MPGPSRYTRTVRRIPLLALAFTSLTTLLSVAVAQSAPPKVPPLPKGGGQATVVASNGKVSLVVAPNASAAPAASGSAAPAEKKSAVEPIERARRGVVTIERAGDVLGLGSVLLNDGRVLTALSALGDGNAIDLRYADGSVVHARVGHSDRIWDLALLIPQVGRWAEGLQASDGDALRSGAQLRAFAPGKTRAQPATVVFKSKRSLLGADEQLIRDVFEVTTKIGPKEFGSPVVDETGNVVAVLGRACVPVEKGPCAPTAFGVPTEALRAFLRTVPTSAVPPAPWLGIQGVVEKSSPVQGVRVVTVSPESPADEAGLRGGGEKDKSDVIVAVDDAPVASPEALSRTMAEKAVGDRVKLLLFSQGKFREVLAVLRPAPLSKK
jgi:serine protease Do